MNDIKNAAGQGGVKIIAQKGKSLGLIMSGDLDENIGAIENWDWYDNFQHGRYINENKVGYGPIKVFNAGVFINGTRVFVGDVSRRRMIFLRKLSYEFDLDITVFWEHGDVAKQFINGRVVAGARRLGGF